MALRMPQEIQQEKVVLSGEQPGPAPYHLTVQAADLCGPEHHLTVHGRAVPPFRQQHGIAQDVVPAGLKVSQDLRPVPALPVDLRRPEPGLAEDVPELLGCLNQRQEYHGFPVPAVPPHFLRDLVEVRVQGGADLPGLKVPRLYPHSGKVQFQGDGQGLNGGEVPVPDGPGKGVFIGQALEHLAQVSHIPAVRCGRYP